MAQSEIIVGVVEKTAGSGSAVDTMIQSSNSGVSNYELVNNSGQVVASVLGLFKILAPIGIQTNVLAGTMTFLKIVVDLKDGKPLNVGDTLNLIGNVAGIVATVTVLAGTSPVVGAVAGGVAIAAALTGVVTADNGLKDWTLNQIRDLWPQAPVLAFPDKYVDTNDQLRRYEDIINDPTVGFRLVVISANSWVYTRMAEPPPPPGTPVEQVDGDGQ
jgi:S1-C subfamily serine protease